MTEELTAQDLQLISDVLSDHAGSLLNVLYNDSTVHSSALRRRDDIWIVNDKVQRIIQNKFGGKWK